MTGLVNFEKYTATTKCSVPGCDTPADYAVALYDEYPNYNEVFFEQDETCPFICQLHHDLNESQAVGERQPRSFVKYPYTNRQQAQGYSKYISVQELIS